MVRAKKGYLMGKLNKGLDSYMKIAIINMAVLYTSHYLSITSTFDWFCIFSVYFKCEFDTVYTFVI